MPRCGHDSRGVKKPIGVFGRDWMGAKVVRERAKAELGLRGRDVRRGPRALSAEERAELVELAGRVLAPA